MKVWITRDRDSFGWYNIFRGDDIPYIAADYWRGHFDCLHIPPELFKDIYGKTLSKGFCKQMELTLKEIE